MLGHGAGQGFVVAGVVGVAGDVGVHALLEHGQGGLLLPAQTAAVDVVAGGLELASHVDEVLGQRDVVLHGDVALGVGDNHLVTQPLQLVDRLLVQGELGAGGAGGELQQKDPLAALAGTCGFAAQAGCPGVKVQLGQLVPVDLPAHEELDAQPARLDCLVQLPKGIPHGPVVKVGVAHVGRGHHLGDAGELGGLHHGQGLVQILGTVVNAGQDVAVDVNHV